MKDHHRRLALIALATLVGCGSEDGSGADSQDIVGGVAAAPGAWNGVVALTDTNGFFKCGGSLVADTWVVTAAHCIDRSKTNGGLSNALIGRTRLNVGEGEVSRVLRAIVHPSYNDVAHDNDIALLELETPSLKPKAVIAPAAQAALANGGGTGTVVGWGATKEGGSTTNELRQVSVPLIANDQCQTSAGLAGVTRNMICAGFREGGGDACQGDSGGPLFAKSSTGVIFQIGIVSFGIGCARANTPGVYTRLGNYLDWLSRTSSGIIPIDGTGAATTSPGAGPIPDATLNSVDEYKVVTELLNCRDAPGTQSSVVAKVPLGSVVTATQEAGRARVATSSDGKPWLLVRANGTTCYAAADFKFLAPVSAPSSSSPGPGPGPGPAPSQSEGPIPLTTLNKVDSYQVVTDLLNCRQGAGTTEAVVVKIPHGTTLTATEDATRSRIAFSADGRPWLLVRSDANVCYASADFKFIAPL